MNRRGKIAVALSLLLLGLLIAYSFTRSFPYVYDDKAVVEDNTILQNADYGTIWTSAYWKGIGHVGESEPLYRPFFLSTVAAFRESGPFLRLLVVLSHFAAGLLVFAAARRFLRLRSVKEAPQADAIALGAATLFLFHPAQVETLVQVIGLMEAVPLAFGLGSLLLAPTHPWIAVFLAALAPGWKETGFLVPATLATYFFVYRRELKTWMSPLVFAVASVGLWLAIRYNAIGSLVAFKQNPYSLLNPLTEMDAWDAFWTRLTLVGYNLRLFLVPYPLSSDYARGTLPVPGYPLQIFVLAGLAAVVWFGATARRVLAKPPAAKEGSALFAFGFAASTLLPTLHITGPIGILFAERFGYGFRAALAIVTAIAIAKWKPNQPRTRRIFFACLASAGVVSTVLFSERVQDWSSSVTLFSEDLRHFPYNAKLQFNLGVAYGAQKQWAQARSHLEQALMLSPDFPEAHFRMGLVYRELGEETRAQEHWRIADQLGFHVPKK